MLPQDGRTLQVNFGGLPVLDGQLVINGQPLADVKVMLADPMSRHSSPFLCYARTDGQGLFRFVGVQPGRYATYYEMPDKRNEWAKVSVVETTGAGDAFNGAFAVALSEGTSAVDAVRFGCATAAISVTRPGTAPSMPTRDEVEQLLRD